MISQETRAQIRRYFYAEHWKIGTIARELGVHPDTVRNAIESERFRSMQPLRASLVDPYIAFLRQTLEQHPSLRATRLYQMIRDRGYSGSVVQLRRSVARLRPHSREAFLQLHVFAGEQAQVDWAHFGHVMVGRARRALSCFVATLSYSRALYLEFFFDQTTENFLRGHVHAFQAWSGQPRVILYDNLKSAVLERRGNQILFHPRLIELSGTITLCHGPAKCARAIRKDAWNAPSAMCAIPSGPAAPSRRWPNATARRCSGAIRSRINGVGLAATTAPSPKPSRKNSLGCWPLLCIRSPPTGSSRCVRTRPSTFASISTTIPSRRKRSAGS